VIPALLITIVILWLAIVILFWVKNRRSKKEIALLLAQNDEIKKSNAELFHITAHDLQEPLRKIQAFGDRIKSVNWQVLDEKSQDYLIYIINAAERMQDLIEELLKYSKVASKTVEPVAIDLNEMVDKILAEYAKKIEALRAEVKIENLPVIEGDVWEIRQLFRLVLENAIKFRHAKRKLEIRIHSQQQKVAANDYTVICIKDNGIGFDNKYTNRMFQIFQRLHQREMYEGTGMGLAICRKIMEQHGGTITAHGIPDQGATFVISFRNSKK
jgi:light-regulated signal transduction histidine kinase (bacteriophytochrome)